MDIALVFPDLSHKGGAESVVVWTAVCLFRQGHRVCVYTENAEASLWPEYGELEQLIRPVQPARKGDRLQRGLGTGRSLASHLNDHDVVVAHNRYGLLWAHATSKPLAWYVHEPSRRLHARVTDAELLRSRENGEVNPDHPAWLQLREWLRKQEGTPWARWKNARRRRMDREMARLPLAVWTNSQFNADCIRQALNIEAEVLYPGSPLPPKGQSTAERGNTVVISSGSPKKNLFGLIQGLAELHRQAPLPAAAIDIWGVGTDAEQFRRQVEAARLQDAVRLLGFMPDEDAREKLAQASLCLFLPLCEPFGIVAAEALMNGVPILASDHGGPAEILRQCGGGCEVDPLQPTKIAERLQHMLTNRRKYLVAADQARPKARNAYGLDSHLQSLETRLQALAKS